MHSSSPPNFHNLLFPVSKNLRRVRLSHVPHPARCCSLICLKGHPISVSTEQNRILMTSHSLWCSLHSNISNLCTSFETFASCLQLVSHCNSSQARRTRKQGLDFCIVNPLRLSERSYGIDPPCFRVLLAWDEYSRSQLKPHQNTPRYSAQHSLAHLIKATPASQSTTLTIPTGSDRSTYLFLHPFPLLYLLAERPILSRRSSTVLYSSTVIGAVFRT